MSVQNNHQRHHDVALKNKQGSNRRLRNSKKREESGHISSTSECKTEREPSPEELHPEGNGPFRLDDKNVYDFIWQYMEDFTEIAQKPSSGAWTKFWDRNHTKDYILIRPSGNPLDLHGLIAMFEKGDIAEFSDTMVAVESVKIFADGAVAVMVFKSEQIFKFKGTQEEDLATWTVVLVADHVAQQPRITNIHRATGKRVGEVFRGNKEASSSST